MAQKPKRSQVKHPGLKKQYNSKVRQEYLDADYIDQLSDKDKEYYNKFNEEYYGAALNFKNLKKNLHNTKKLKKDCTDRNNARNRCIYGIEKAKSRLIDTEDNSVEKTSSNPEDSLIEYIDSKNEKL